MVETAALVTLTLWTMLGAAAAAAMAVLLWRAFIQWLGSSAEQARLDLARQSARCGLYPRS